MKIGVYMRVSTEDQNLDSQRHALGEYLDKLALEQGPQDVKWYEDHGFSGAYNKRPQYMKMLEDAEAGRLDMILVYKMDRLTRNASTAISTILRLDEMDVKFVSVTQPMFSHGTPFRHAMIAIFAELAQMERETIVERINTGIAAAKKRGVKFGRPTVLTEEKKAQIISLREKDMGIKRIAKEVGISVAVCHGFIKKEIG